MPDPHSITPLPPEQTASASSQTPPARPREPERAHGTSSRGNWSIGVGSAAAVREETCSCFAVVFSFWLFATVSMTMILGVYGSVTIVLGPTSSKVFQPSSVFVKSVKVENLMGNHGGRPILYGTYGYPPLDVFSSWGETLNVSLPSGAEKANAANVFLTPLLCLPQEWKLYLNRGSAINISYHVSSRSSSVFLIVAQGTEAFTRWLENPTEPNTTLSWNVIHGGLTFLVFWSFNLLNNLQSAHEGGAGHRSVGTEPQRAPLLSHKDDDLSSWGSSYDSLPQDEEDLDFLPGGPIDGKLPGDGQTSNNTRRLCAICFDAPRDCFFLPCGHCVACFACGTRIAEASGTCPVCRRNMKKQMVAAGEDHISHCTASSAVAAR
ncbi:uncharacterized protein HKW66_Vig0115780 [Vigna angularis]|uniref:RING-type domain-containing protein n=1 Tax=Phaseolus angularis TaxID=3914 RepID=A0A8T0KY63_PHAAN|nr:uncharacterized protein HKW66_Vig0115780 [Vigna angularis]